MKLNVLLLSILVICIVIHGASQQNSTSPQNATQESMPWIQDMIEKAIMNAINSTLLSGFNRGLELMNFLLAYNVPPELANMLSSVHMEIIKMLAPLYLLVLSWNAIEVMTSEVIINQAKARITIQNSVVSMVLVASSLQIYKLLLSLSQGISKYLLYIQFDSKLANTISAVEVAGALGAFAVVLLPAVEILIILVILFLLIRIYILAVGVLLFPIGIFMYFFSPLKKYGKLITSVILYFMFIQVIIALMVYVMNALMAAPPQSFGPIPAEDLMKLRVLLYIGGIFLIMIVPLGILLQLVLIVAFPEIMIPMYVTSLAGVAAGTTAAAGSVVSSKLSVRE
ncbi:hypothetical protein H0N98_04685 [Candidatus Micrarchaeota archaeon]|nr:hypothetical protein [Candidatus Micrarchaeota archaeon]